MLHHQLHLIISFIFTLCLFAQSQIDGNITVGSSITATVNSTPWLSPSRDYAFGFQQLQNNTDMFILSIWFNRIPDRTIVWFERSSYPVPSGSTLQLTAAQGLLLRDSRGRLLWNTSGFADQVSYGFMNDTGNFILSGSNSAWLWQSFSNPSDTILPTQTIGIGQMIISRKTEANFSGGRFYGRMLSSGNFVLQTQSEPSNTRIDSEYYSSETSDANASIAGYQVLLNERGSISINRRNGLQVTLTPRSIPSASEVFYKASLDFDGVFTHYYHPRSFSGNPGWTSVRSWPDNICASINGQFGSGACGYNSICTLRGQRPVCHCPQGFSLADQNEPYGNCWPSFVPNCRNPENSSAFDLFGVPNTDWPMNGYEIILPTTEANCIRSCLEDCLCAAATYASNGCWKKTLPLSNGRVDNSLNVTTFLKYRKGDVPFPGPNLPTPGPPRRDQKKLITIGSVLLGSSALINFLLMTAACISSFVIYKKKTRVPNSSHMSSTAALRCFTYKELVQATNGFTEELGRGSFGIVYKGAAPDAPENFVAVKKLDRVTEDSDKEFKMEVNSIGQTHHKNLVRLYGFCDEGPNRLLVYEYMREGTLADFLFGPSKPGWNLRCFMALGVARGLAYLHEECITQIIHCDIKPQNILIDEHSNARISDFGLAKLLRMDQTKTLTNIRGTKGYVAPEWFRNMKITSKVDVYSFGVLLLEIISCRKSVENKENIEDEENPILTDWVWDCFQEKRLESLVDEDTEALSDKNRLERFVMVGIWCIQEDPSLRPSMRKASQMLEGIIEVEKPPCPSPFSSRA